MGYDPSGEGWLPYSGLSYPGEIHNAVLHHIVANYPEFKFHKEAGGDLKEVKGTV